MRIFNLVCDLVAVHLQETTGNVEAFAQHRQGQIWMFLRAECIVDGVLDRDRLRYVIGGAVQAGRMTEDDPLQSGRAHGERQSQMRTTSGLFCLITKTNEEHKHYTLRS